MGRGRGITGELISHGGAWTEDWGNEGWGIVHMIQMEMLDPLVLMVHL